MPGQPTFWRLDVPPLSLSVVQHANDEWRLQALVLEPALAVAQNDDS